jgi:hypothetical protein
MRLSDLIKALQHIERTHGNLRVLEERQVWYDCFEFFPGSIKLDERVKEITGYHDEDNRHHFDKSGAVPKTARDCRELKAFVL